MSIKTVTVILRKEISAHMLTYRRTALKSRVCSSPLQFLHDFLLITSHSHSKTALLNGHCVDIFKMTTHEISITVVIKVNTTLALRKLMCYDGISSVHTVGSILPEYETHTRNNASTVCMTVKFFGSDLTLVILCHW